MVLEFGSNIVTIVKIFMYSMVAIMAMGSIVTMVLAGLSKE